MMKIEKKLIYVSPVVEVRRVFLEAGIAAPVSAGRLSSVGVEDWANGGVDEYLGDAVGEGGDLCVFW
jgi:hypothetical protein